MEKQTMTNYTNYSEFFQLKVNPPEISQATFHEHPDWWKKTYPHKTFVTLLKRTEKMLARANEMDKHSIWIHGAYGTGKSQVTWTLRSLLTCSDADFEEYFNEYAPLRDEGDLKRKLSGHRKARKRVVAARHDSDAISGPDDLIGAVFESLTAALDDAGIQYDAGATLRGGIVKWLDGKAERSYFGSLIGAEPYCHKGCFAGKMVEDILDTLKRGEQADELLKEIRRLAKDKGITALKFSKEDLSGWIKETVERNNLHLVLVWDEFSSFFKNNKTRLDTLQSLAELSGETRFNLVIVTHFTTAYLPENDNSAKIVVDRFRPDIEIKLPENIAFDLIGDALKVKPELKAKWDKYAGDLDSRMEEPRRKVSKMLKDVSEGVFRLMLPFHPYAALALKNIAALFDSNQRSMFTFIAAEEDEKAFKWFINGHTPELGDILSVDMLWDYFYETGRSARTGEKGRSNLDAQVRSILEVYPEKAEKLDSKQQRVLKVILMFQALSKKLNNLPEFLGTEENLRLVFEGEVSERPIIANRLVQEKILFVDEVRGKRVYQAPMSTGGRDLQEIEKLKQGFISSTKTKELLKDWKQEDILRLPKALEERFDVRIASPDSFQMILNQMLAQDAKNYRMRALLVVGRNDVDASAAKDAIDKALSDPRSGNVVFIDATGEELGDEAFEKWAEYKARGSWYARKDQQQSNNAYSEAEKVLSTWRDQIADGAFTVRTKRNEIGATCHGAAEVGEEMRLSVRERYPNALEFTSGIVDTLFNAATKGEVSAGAWGGIDKMPAGEKSGKMNEKVEKAVLGEVKSMEGYWKSKPALEISKIKARVEQKLQMEFKAGGKGKVAFSDIVEMLFDVGFMPTAFHGYLAGFLLKEYVGGDYRFSRDDESVPLTVTNLTEGILAYFKQVLGTGGNRYHEAFIEMLTEDQRRFASLAKTVFNLDENASIDSVVRQIVVRVKDFQYPLWCFTSLPEAVGAEPYIERFTLLMNPANQRGVTLSGLASEIGKMAAGNEGIETKLSALFTKEKAFEAINAWLDEFEDGAFREAAREINAPDPLSDVRRCFGENSGDAGLWLWDQATIKSAIQNLMRDYRIVAESAKRSFVTPTNSLWDCIESWRDKISTVCIPFATLVTLRPQCRRFLDLLKEIAEGGHLEQKDRREAFYREITDNCDLNKDMLDGCLALFKSTYSEQLAGLDDAEIEGLYRSLDRSSFRLDKPQYEQMLEQKVAEVKRNQGRTKLLSMWKERTGTDTPAEWSKRFKTPILAMVPDSTPHFTELCKTIEAMNDKTLPATRVEKALEFLVEHPEVFSWFDGSKADEAFRRRVIGRYSAVLTDAEKVRMRLAATLGQEVCDWFADPRLDGILRKLAEHEYNLNSANLVREKIKSMSADEAKGYLIDLVVDSFDVGISILSRG